MSNEVAVLPPKEKAIDVYSKPSGLDPYLDQIREQVDEFKKTPPKLTTVTGRAEYKSMAHRVARMKTALEEMGKNLSAEAKALPKKIDAERKRAWDILETWQDEILEPVIKYEAEQKAIEEKRLAEEAAAEAQRLAEIAARELQEQVDRDHELAIYQYADYLREQEEARKQAIIDAENAAKAQKEREEQIAKDAAENARVAAEKEAQAAIEKANREKLEAENARLRQEQEAKEAADKAEADRIAAAKKSEDDKQAAIEAERKRQADAVEAERLETEKRERNKAHVGQKRKEAKESLMAACGVSEDVARAIVLAITNGKIENVTINY